MSLALLTFGLLCACPTQAQTQGGYPGGGSGGGYPGGGGWQLDHYECTGADTWTDGAGGHANSWPATTAAFLLQFGHQYGSPDQSVGMVTTVFIWQGTGQPTDKVYTLISSYADAAGTPFGPPADDGFGDPGTGNGENCSAGTHLVEVQNPNHSTTVKTLPYSLSAICGSSGYTTWVTFQAVVDTDLHPMNVVATRVDATDPHNAKVWFRTEPAGAAAQTVTFTGGSSGTQTQSRVSGDFSFTFDEGQLPNGSSTFTLQWTPASPFTAIPGGGTITTNATRTSHMATGSSPLFYSVTVGGIDGGLVLVVPTQYYDARETYNTFAYSLPVIAESKTIWAGGSNVNLGTINNPNVPSQIFGWGESHYYQDDAGTYGNASMQNETYPTIPAQSLWFQSKNSSSDLFFAPNHNLVAVSHCDTIVLNATNSPAMVIPFFYAFPTITVPIN